MLQAAGYCYEDLAIGQSASISKTITDADVRTFAALSTDTNPVHLSDTAAAASPFHHRVAHGMLVSSLISAALGSHLPGPGTIYISQSLNFLAPVPIGSTVRATVEVLELLDHHHVRLRTVCTIDATEVVIAGDAVVVVSGDALVKVPSRAT